MLYMYLIVIISLTKPKTEQQATEFYKFLISEIFAQQLKRDNTHTHTNRHIHSHTHTHIHKYEQFALAMAGPLERLKIPRNLHFCFLLFLLFVVFGDWLIILWSMYYILLSFVVVSSFFRTMINAYQYVISLETIPYTEGKLICLFVFSIFNCILYFLFCFCFCFYFESSYKTLHKVCIKVVFVVFCFWDSSCFPC